MNVTKKTYKAGGGIEKPKYFLGGLLKAAAPLAAFIPGVGPLAAAGISAATGFAGQQIEQGQANKRMQAMANRAPVAPKTFAAASHGFRTGGATGKKKAKDPKTSSEVKEYNKQLNENIRKRMEAMKKGDYSGIGKTLDPDKKKATGGKVDEGGRQFKKDYKSMSLSPIQQQYMEHKGGIEKPIGQDATKFEGNSHEAGGIDLDANTEVEGGETKDVVAGGEYIFSKKVKVPGTYKTFAEIHEEMISNNADPAQVQQLAQLQERVTGRQ